MLFCSVRLLIRTASSAYLLCIKLFHTLTYQALVLRLGLGSAVSYEDFRIEDMCADVSYKKCQHKYSAFSTLAVFSPLPPPSLSFSCPPLLKRRWCFAAGSPLFRSLFLTGKWKWKWLEKLTQDERCLCQSSGLRTQLRSRLQCNGLVPANLLLLPMYLEAFHAHDQQLPLSLLFYPASSDTPSAATTIPPCRQKSVYATLT